MLFEWNIGLPVLWSLLSVENHSFTDKFMNIKKIIFSLCECLFCFFTEQCVAQLNNTFKLLISEEGIMNKYFIGTKVMKS